MTTTESSHSATTSKWSCVRRDLIAPDYPRFGHSDHPDAALFSYTFDHLATVIEHFVTTVGLSKYNLYLQD